MRIIWSREHLYDSLPSFCDPLNRLLLIQVLIFQLQLLIHNQSVNESKNHAPIEKQTEHDSNIACRLQFPDEGQMDHSCPDVLMETCGCPHAAHGDERPPHFWESGSGRLQARRRLVSFSIPIRKQAFSELTFRPWFKNCSRFLARDNS